MLRALRDEFQGNLYDLWRTNRRSDLHRYLFGGVFSSPSPVGAMGEVAGTGDWFIDVDGRLVVVRRTSETTTGQVSITALHQTSGNMADGFGSGYAYANQDVTSGIKYIAATYAVRDGADDTAKLSWRIASAGTIAERMSLTAAGVLTTTGDLVVGGADIGIPADLDLFGMASGIGTVRGALNVGANALASSLGHAGVDRLYVNASAYIDGATAGQLTYTGSNLFTADAATEFRVQRNVNQGVDVYGTATANFLVSWSVDAAKKNTYIFNDQATMAIWLGIGAVADANLQLRIADGLMAPYADSDLDFGSSTRYFANAYIDRTYWLATAYTEAPSASYLVDTVGGTATFGRIAGHIGIPATGKLFLDGVTALGHTSIRESANDIMSFEVGADRVHISTSAIYAQQDNAIRLGAANVGYIAVDLSDGNTTAPTAEGEVRVDGTQKQFYGYLGGELTRFASLPAPRIVDSTPIYSGTSGAWAEQVVDTITIPSAKNVVGNTFIVRLQGIWFITPKGVSPVSTLTLKLRVESTDILSTSIDTSGWVNTECGVFEFEIAVTLRSATAAEITFPKLAYRREAQAAHPLGTGTPVWLASGYTTNITTAGDITITVRSQLSNASTTNNSSYILMRKANAPNMI